MTWYLSVSRGIRSQNMCEEVGKPSKSRAASASDYAGVVIEYLNTINGGGLVPGLVQTLINGRSMGARLRQGWTGYAMNLTMARTRMALRVIAGLQSKG